jgi:transposase
LEADSAVLRARAARQRDRGKRNRLIALALIAEGLSLNDAEVQSGISSGTIRNCLRRYEGGIAAVCSMSATHRKSRPLAQSRQL